ncbi:MAG: cyclase family protein [Candidatus Lambdaproteobacteria bacterium]|nr:cyclase family protein [Candidatus Lambdaproteobacteria bacterium]
MGDYPRYADLPRSPKTGMPSAWGVWGDADELGSLNHITDETALRAAALVRRGRRFNLDLPLHVPYGEILPPPEPGKMGFRSRRVYEPTLFTRDDGDLIARDDKLDNFFPQASTQWDSLCHYGDIDHRFYNGVTEEQITHGPGGRNGIHNMAEFGIVTRAVLADMVRYYADRGQAYDPVNEYVVTPDDLLACLRQQGVTLRPGDVLLVRLGWLALFLSTAGAAARDALFHSWRCSGLSGQEDMWEFLWDQRIAAVATDNVTVEVFPRTPRKPCLHLALPHLGMTLGELFYLEALADDCAQDGHYDCMLTSSPLNLRGGVGSPANAIAIK